MGMAVVTVASGGMPVIDVTGTKPGNGMAVTEAANGRGVPVTKVTPIVLGGRQAIAVTYVNPPL